MITLAELSTKRPENAVLDAKVVSFRIYDIANIYEGKKVSNSHPTEQ